MGGEDENMISKRMMVALGSSSLVSGVMNTATGLE
jgi:hypothetical protein